MPATYTYNDAIDDAKTVIAHAIQETVAPLDDVTAEPYIKLMLALADRLDALKRPSRRKRKTSTG
jgi:hypothetical protein